MQNRTLDNRVFNVEQRQRTGPVNAGRARLKEFKELAPTITSSDIVFWLGSRPDPLNDPVGAKLTPAAVAEKPVGWWVELMPADEELKSRIASRVSEIVSKVAFDGNQTAHVNMLCRWQKRLDPDTQLVELHAIDEAYSRTVWWSLAEVWAWRSASGLATHAAFWLMLIVLYPRSTGVQSLFFWNPMIRKIGGLGYVGLMLTLVPPLRRIVLWPFQRALLADAELDAFDADSFFKETPVYDPASGERGDAVEVIPQLRGRLVLEGDSGLGKSMLLRFAETVYAMRLADERELTCDEFRDELACLELHKLTIVRRAMTDSGNTRYWRFRHDKVMEFLMLPALLGNPERQGKHIRDSRFRGAYQLLAMRLGESDSARLKEQLIQHTVKTNDISTLTPFIEELNIRQLSPATRVRRRSA